MYAIDFIVHSFLEDDRISDEATDLYQTGLSLREIARKLGRSKTKIRNVLISAGHELRESTPQATNIRALNRGKQSARPYFGFCYFQGAIVKDPREFATLQLIHKFWIEKRTIHQIVLELNKRKIRSRMGKAWSWAAVQNLIKRFESKTVILKAGGRYEFR